jgi:hypothetical protein
MHIKLFFCYFLVQSLWSCSNDAKKQERKIKVDIYIAPRIYNCNLYVDGGVFNYPLYGKSILLSKSKTCFENSFLKDSDSIVTMFYNCRFIEQYKINKIFKGAKLNTDVSVYSRPPRALILVHYPNSIDSVFVYQEKIWTYKGLGYKMSKYQDSFLLADVPIELKENWKSP